jgi:hypothetical protein
MNNIIYTSLKDEYISNNSSVPHILPHQLATIDYLYKKCKEKSESVLLFHKMGSGKTIISLLFAILVSNEFKIIIILPNINILQLWRDQLEKSLILLANEAYNIDNIIFTTRSKFNEENEKFKNVNYNDAKNNIYNKCITIIDEAHNFFGTVTGEILLNLRKTTNIIYILLTGSPITNTVETLKYIVELLINEPFDENKYIESIGNKVFEKKINKACITFLNEKLKGLISYYHGKDKEIPVPYFHGTKIYLYPVIFCYMSAIQEENYRKIAESTINEMFIKLLMNVSLCALGNKENYENFENIIEQDNLQLLPNLYIKNKLLAGSELVDLNISSKLKKLRDSLLTEKHGKRFVYFANSTIGSVVIKSVMYANGISEYGKEIVQNPVCINCFRLKTCKTCAYMKFCIITSKETTKNYNISELLDIYNNELNDDGSDILILFGSKIISEAYTLRNVTDIWFLTVPETKSELKQCIARAVRSFSHKTSDIKIRINLCIAIPKRIQKIDSEVYTNKLIEDIKKMESITVDDENRTIIYSKFEKKLNEDKNLTYDLKKQLYLELKSEKSKVADNVFIKLSELYNDIPTDELMYILIIEKLRRFSFKYEEFTISQFIVFLFEKFIIDNYTEIRKKILTYIDMCLNDSLVVYNKNLNSKCYLYNIKKDIIICVPINLEYNDHLLKIDFTN